MSATSNHVCVYHNCNINQRKQKHVSFFRFPIKNSELTKQWQINCGNIEIALKDSNSLGNKLICEKHFLSSEIIINSKRKLLQKNAIPIKYSTTVNEIKVPIITSTTTLRTYGNQKVLQDTTKQTSFNYSNKIEMIKDIKQETELCDTQQPSFNFCDVKETFLQDTKEKVEPSAINPEPIINHIQCISPVQYNKLKRRLTRLTVTNRRMKQENFRLRKRPDFNEALYRSLDIKSPSVKTFVLMQVLHKKGTEWTQSEKDLALSIYMKSPTTYRFLFKNLGFVLPSPKTICSWSLPKSPLT